VNPDLVKKFMENHDKTPTKSDIKDAFFIADMVKDVYYSFVKETCEVFTELRVLMANRETPVHRLVSVKNLIHRWVEIFPGTVANIQAPHWLRIASDTASFSNAY